MLCVVSGAAMAVVQSQAELEGFLNAAASVSKEHPVVVSEFIEGANEVEL